MIRSYETLTELWRFGCRDLLFMPLEKFNQGWTAGATTGLFDNVLSCKSMEFDFDPAKDLWLTKHRFGKLQRDYIDYDLLPQFVDLCSIKKMPMTLSRRGTVTQMPCRTHGKQARDDGRKENYKWGNCILGFTFRPADSRKVPYKGVFTMHSRTSYISYMGGYDLALCYKIAQAIAEVRDCPVEDFAFRWHADSLQWYSIKSMPYLINHGYQDTLEEYRGERTKKQEQYLAQHPSLKISANSYHFLNKRWENEDPPKYGPTHRIWELMFGLRQRPNSVPLDTLNLEALN